MCHMLAMHRTSNRIDILVVRPQSESGTMIDAQYDNVEAQLAI